jgi:hypothetical protein
MIGVITLNALYHSALISLSQFLFLNKTGNGLLTSASLLQKNEGLLCSDVSGSPRAARLFMETHAAIPPGSLPTLPRKKRMMMPNARSCGGTSYVAAQTEKYYAQRSD